MLKRLPEISVRLALCLLIALAAGCASSTSQPPLEEQPVVQPLPVFPPQDVIQSGDYAGFLTKNQEALKSCQEPQQCAMALFNIAFAHCYSKSPYYNPAKAIKYLDDLIKGSPGTPWAYQAMIWEDLMKKGLKKETRKTKPRGEAKEETKPAATNEESVQKDKAVESVSAAEPAPLETEADRQQQMEEQIRSKDKTIKELNRQLERSRQIDIDIEKKNGDFHSEDYMAAEKILVVDDDPGLLTLMKARLEAARYQVTLAKCGEEAIACASESIFCASILDFKMEGINGIELMEKLLKIQPYLPVIILTAYGTIERAVEATKKGAYDFLTKPFEAKDLLYRLEKAFEVGKLKIEVERLRHMVQERYHFDNIIASSEKMQRILSQVHQVAATDSTVCLYGESGTGKELMAKAIHLSSPRSKGPFIAINCGAIPEGLLESELFGHVKGAFTGAEQPKKGLLQLADGGTLFMDEIGELPPTLQVKLLRVFQDREFYAVGGVKSIRVDIRLIAATNRDLRKAIQEGKFREDLYYRIHVIPIFLPTLRERIEDVPLLVNHFLQHFNREMNKNVQGFSPEVMQRLMLHAWPGNVRELANVVERAVALSSNSVITPDYLFLGGDETPEKRALLPLNEAREKHDRAYLIQVLRETGGNVSRAAALAGRYRAEFYKLLHKYRLNATDYKSA